jgi:hypothetical protein
MSYSTPQQLRFPPLAGYTIRADFDGGALSSDFGALLLRGIDRQIGLTERLAAAIHDKRHPSYIDHPLRDLLAQRIYQIASGYADGNDANSLRHDPLFKLSVERPPLEPTQDLASAPTFSRLEHSVDRKDLYRLTHALVDHFIASYPEPPTAIVLDLDHSDDPTHGQQEFAFYNHHYQSYCYLPLFIFEGTSQTLVMACLRPGKRPPGLENAMILVRLLSYLRQQFPLMACSSYTTYVGGCLQEPFDPPVVSFEAQRAVGGVPSLTPGRCWPRSRRSFTLALIHQGLQ